MLLNANIVFLQDKNFWGSLMTPCLKTWGSLANLEGQNFFLCKIPFYLFAYASILKVFEECPLTQDNGRLEIVCMFY